MPLDLDDLALAEPIYEELPGWPELSGTTIPPAAAAFVDRVSALTGIPVWVTSWGPGARRPSSRTIPSAAARPTDENRDDDPTTGSV